MFSFFKKSDLKKVNEHRKDAVVIGNFCNWLYQTKDAHITLKVYLNGEKEETLLSVPFNDEQINIFLAEYWNINLDNARKELSGNKGSLENKTLDELDNMQLKDLPK